MQQFFVLLTITLCVNLSTCRPAEEPTKFHLDVNEKNVNNVAQSTTSAGRLGPGNFLASEARNNVASVIAGGTNFLTQKRSVVSPTTVPKPRETVHLEYSSAQAILEKPLKNPLERALQSFVHPTPIVDGIKEEEKYGNNGDQLLGINRAIVDKYEGFSNFLNNVIDLPGFIAKRASRNLTERLNVVGAKLIGLM